METDKDHIHYMIETEPTISISKVVNLIKSYTTYYPTDRLIPILVSCGNCLLA